VIKANQSARKNRVLSVECQAKLLKNVQGTHASSTVVVFIKFRVTPTNFGNMCLSKSS